MRNNQNEDRSSNDAGEYAGPLFTIRWKWLFGTFAVLAVMATTLLGVYFYQTRDKSEFLIKVFREEEENGEWRKGIPLLTQYHRDNPDDMAVVRELAEAFERNGNWSADWKNAAYYYEILLAEKVSDEERLQLLEKVLENKRRVNGEDLLPTIQRILKLEPENALAWKSMVSVRLPMLETGIYQSGPGEPDTFDRLINKALELNPADVYVVSIYCGLLRTDSQNARRCMSPGFRDKPLATREAEADVLMEDLVRNNPESPEALLTHYVYRLQNRQLDRNATEIDPELEKVLELDPNNPTAMMYAGMFYEQRAVRLKMGLNSISPDESVDPVESVDSVEGGENFDERWTRAIGQYEKMIATSPGNRAGYLQLAAIYALDGEKDKQVEVLERANKALRSGDPGVLFALVLAHLENNDPKNATRVLGMIDAWIKRNRGAVTAETIDDYMKMVTLYEGQSLAIAGQPKEALEKFRGIFESSIPHRIDVRLVYNSMMMYAVLLEETLHLDLSIEVYEKTLSYLNTETHRRDPFNFMRMDRTYLAAILALGQLGQTGRLATFLNNYVDFLRKEVESQQTNQQPTIQLVRFTLATALYRQIMMQPADKRDWTELNALLANLKNNRFRIDPPWQVDLLQANVIWESRVQSGASVDEVLIPLQLAAIDNNDDLLFLVSLEEVYHRFNLPKNSKNVLEQIRTFPEGEGLAFWYVIKAVRAEQLGNLQEAKKLIDEATEKVPDLQKDIFLAVQESLGRSIEEGSRSILRERRDLARLRETNTKNPTLQSLFRQGLMELDFGYTSNVALLVDQLRKLEDKDHTLSLFLDAERLLQEAKDDKDSKIVTVRSRFQELSLKRPKWEYTWLLEADLADKIGKEEDVIVALGKAIDAGNTDPMRHRDLIELLIKKGRMSEAEEAISRSIAMFPNLRLMDYRRLDPPFQRISRDFFRAILREDSNAAGKIAEQWIELAITSQVEERVLALFRSIIGRGFYGNGELSIAEQYFQKAANVGGDAVLPLARYLVDKGEIQEALDMVYKEMKKSQTPELFLQPVLLLIQDKGDVPAGIEQFDKFVLDVQPDEIGEAITLSHYILYLMNRGMNDDALPFYHRLNELAPDNSVVLNDLAYLVAFQATDDSTIRQANIVEAINLIEEAGSLEPDNPNIVDTKGLIVLLQGNPEEALPLFEEAVKITEKGMASRAIIYRLHLAVALLRAGEKDRAEEEFAEIRVMLVPQIDLLSESNRNYTGELLEAFPEEELEVRSEEQGEVFSP